MSVYDSSFGQQVFHDSYSNKQMSNQPVLGFQRVEKGIQTRYLQRSSAGNICIIHLLAPSKILQLKHTFTIDICGYPWSRTNPFTIWVQFKQLYLYVLLVAPVTESRLRT